MATPAATAVCAHPACGATFTRGPRRLYCSLACCRRAQAPTTAGGRGSAGGRAGANSPRRKGVDPTTTTTRSYTDEELTFLKAMEKYKRESRRPYPTWSEALEVLKSLGYRKVPPG